MHARVQGSPGRANAQGVGPARRRRRRAGERGAVHVLAQGDPAVCCMLMLVVGLGAGARIPAPHGRPTGRHALRAGALGTRHRAGRAVIVTAPGSSVPSELHEPRFGFVGHRQFGVNFWTHSVDEAVGHTGTIQGTIASSANSARRALSSAASEIAGRSTTVRAGTGHPTLAAAHEMEILLVRASVGWRAGEM